MIIREKTLASISLGHEKLSAYFSNGLGALASTDKRHVKVPDTSLINGSLALDMAARKEMADDYRWDYAIDYNNNVYFLEVHPAFTSEISIMIKKVDGLGKWLRAIDADLLSLPPVERKFYWISSGKTSLRITPNSRQAKQLAAKRIVPVGTIWDYLKI